MKKGKRNWNVKFRMEKNKEIWEKLPAMPVLQVTHKKINEICYWLARLCPNVISVRYYEQGSHKSEGFHRSKNHRTMSIEEAQKKITNMQC